MVPGVTFIEDFIDSSTYLFEYFRTNIKWDENMKSRKTACFGEPYDYSEQVYDFQPLLPGMLDICLKVQGAFGFLPNNCLLNYYENGNASIGYHGDTTVMLEPNSGIAVLSLGGMRTMIFRNAADKSVKYHYAMPSGSLLYMTNEMQATWQHGIKPEATDQARISLTFRQMIPGFRKGD